MNTIYTVEDVAYLLGVKEETVLRWIRKGELRSFVVDHGCYDRGYRITASSVEDFMEKHQYRHRGPNLETIVLKQQIRDRLDTLDEYEDRLYQEKCFLEGLQNFIEEMGL